MDTHQLSPNTQAILLLCGQFGIDTIYKPLSVTEYGAFAHWLMQQELTPADLLSPEGEAHLQGYTERNVTPVRLKGLLQRGGAMALALEHWINKGLWVLTRSDTQYPQRLKDVLRHLAPPVLYGAGNMDLLNQGGLAMVGSRNVDEQGLEFTRQVVELCAEKGVDIISGGAKGVDQQAMLAGLENGTKVIGVLSHGVAQASVSSLYRKWISQNNLALVSPYHPEAGFSIGTAMGRNKYIYALSDACLVVASDVSGGTWTGANENLKHRWVPLLVRESVDAPVGNAQLIELGGNPVDLDNFKAANDLLTWMQSMPMLPEPAPKAQQDSLFALAGAKVMTYEQLQTESATIAFEPASVAYAVPVDSFALVWPEMVHILDQPVTVEELAQRLQLVEAQAEVWLKRAIDEGLLVQVGDTYIKKSAES